MRKQCGNRVISRHLLVLKYTCTFFVSFSINVGGIIIKSGKSNISCYPMLFLPFIHILIDS